MGMPCDNECFFWQLTRRLIPDPDGSVTLGSRRISMCIECEAAARGGDKSHWTPEGRAEDEALPPSQMYDSLITVGKERSLKKSKETRLMLMGWCS